MKALLTALLCLAAAPAWANADLAAKRNCLGCHAIDAKRVGPAYKDVAQKYAGQKDAVAKLATKIQTGGVGVWGQIPMPANPIPDAEARLLATWVLGLK